MGWHDTEYDPRVDGYAEDDDRPSESDLYDDDEYDEGDEPAEGDIHEPGFSEEEGRALPFDTPTYSPGGGYDDYDPNSNENRVGAILTQAQQWPDRCAANSNNDDNDFSSQLTAAFDREAMPWYHTTPYDLPVGTRLTPGGGESPNDFVDDDPETGARSHVWLSKEPGAWADQFITYDKDDEWGDNPINPFTYEVEPEGEPRQVGHPGDDQWVVPTSATITRVHQRGGPAPEDQRGGPIHQAFRLAWGDAPPPKKKPKPKPSEPVGQDVKRLKGTDTGLYGTDESDLYDVYAQPSPHGNSWDVIRPIGR